MTSLIIIQSLFCVLISTSISQAFIPHPLIAHGALSSNSITHAEITQLAVIRSLARFLYDVHLHSNDTNTTTINEEKFFASEYTIDDLYELIYPKFDSVERSLYTLPLKFILDSIMTFNVLVDFDEKTKRVSAAHFDNEAFTNASRRILRFRQTIVNQTRDTNTKDLTYARELLGQLFHTLQDFYSHSNWIEMGKTDINELIGFNETIGTIAQPNQATCTNNGCTKIEKTCSLWQQITLNVCPLVYYDCKNNILPDINNQEILTSGYAGNDVSETNELLQKPTNVEKCSHGSVLDSSSHIPAIGGINKDSYSLIFSPHSNLHKQAADVAIKATERFLNDIRRDVGDENYDRLLAIHPSANQRQYALDALTHGKRFRFLVPQLATSLTEGGPILTRLRNLFKKLYRLIKWVFTGVLFGDDPINQPTYDLSDKGVNVKDVNNFRAAPYVLGKEELRRKKRMIQLSRTRRYL